MTNSTIKLRKLFTFICLSLLFIGIQSQVRVLSVQYKTDKTIINYQVPLNYLLVLNFTYVPDSNYAELFPVVEMQRLSSNFKVTYTINNANVADQKQLLKPNHQIKGQLVNFMSYYRVTFNEYSPTIPGYFSVYILQNNKLRQQVQFNKKDNSFLSLFIFELNKYQNVPVKLQFQRILPYFSMNTLQRSFVNYYPITAGNSALTLTDSKLIEGQYMLSFFKFGFQSCDMKFIIHQVSSSTDCGDNVLQKTEECDNGNNRGCVNCKVQKGYKCYGGLYSSSLCFPICGDGILTVQEQCDNNNNTGCFNCKPVPGFICRNNIKYTSSCQTMCGDRIRASTQECDNGYQPGCYNCVQSKGFVCSGDVGTISKCLPICGDGIRVYTEQCDNGGKLGCLTCKQPDFGWDCVGDEGQISTCSAICGDGLRYGAEACDNGNKQGCSSNCKVDRGYYCTGATGKASTCATKCGDMIKAGQEQCDNGNKAGCTNCQIDSGYACKIATNGGSYCYKV